MKSRLMFAATVSGLVMLGSGASWSQSAGQDNERARSGGVDTIIVTARRKAESLQDTPVSVTAFTSAMIERNGIVDINDIALRTPGLSYGNYGDEKLSPLSLRGVIGDSGSAGADPAVGIYLDEVFLGQGAGATLDLFDLETVEVLRGPQGTLFGRNTIGGLIHYRTAKPTDDFEAYVDLELGDYGRRRIGGAVSGPVFEGSVLGRLAFVRNQRDGTSYNAVLDEDVNTEDTWSARGQLQFLLGEATDWRLSADYREVDQDALVLDTLSYNDASTFALVAFNQARLDRNTDPFDRKVYADDLTYERSTAYSLASHFSTTLGAVSLTNITAYREHEYENRSDTERSALEWAYDGDPEEGSKLSNELRLSWSTQNFDWIAGLYFYRQDTSNLSFIEFGPDLMTLFGLGPVTLDAGSDAEMETTSYAAFGSATWTLSDRLDISLGGRYTYEEKSIDYTQSDPLGLLGGDFAIVAEDDWAEFTPSGNIRYRFNDDMLGYATVSRGFKSGGFNDALGDANGISFDPETLTNYEAGLKTTLFGGLAQANLALFYMDWEDIQISGDNPATPVFDPIIVNAGAAHSSGVEFELLSEPTDRLTLNFSASLLEAEYDEGALTDGTPLAEIPRAPDYTAVLGALYQAPLADSVEWFLGGEVLARGESFLTIDNQEDGRVGAHALINIQAGLEAPDGRWRLTFWGRNIGDETVKQRLFDLAGQDVIGQKFIILNEPATYGVNLRLQY